MAALIFSSDFNAEALRLKVFLRLKASRDLLDFWKTENQGELLLA
jgi:hypothetical protein